MLSVGLTGNVAAGKSTVAELFRRWGATIIDADRLVREAQAPGSPLLAVIAGRLGADLVDPAGSLDRAALRRRVLHDPTAMAELNAIVHPEVYRRRAALEAEARRRGDRIVVSDIPLLFESGDPAAFDAVVLVDAPPALRRTRLLADRGLTADEADRLIAAQAPSPAKRAASTYVIDNDGDRASLEARARAIWTALETMAPSRGA